MEDITNDSTVVAMDSEMAELVRGIIIPELDPFDPSEANAVLEEAQRGNAAAQYIVGMALESLQPPRKNDARNWYMLAAQKGYAPAKEKLESLRLQ